MRLWAMRTRAFSGEEATRLLSVLPLSERERLTDGERLREDSLWAYSLLRLVIDESFGMELPKISRAEGGKPYFPAHPEICFSISHTDGAVLVGLWDREIGVDLEKDRPAPERVRRLLDAGEEPFFSEWVRWEACAKCAGKSVLSVLRTGKLPEDVVYQSVQIFDGYFAGAAARGETIEPALFCVDAEQLFDGC